MTTRQESGRGSEAGGQPKAVGTATLVACLILFAPFGPLSPASFLLPPLSAQDRPFPEEQAFFEDTRENLSRSTRVQNRYAYKERRTELHMNPFGRIGTGGLVLYEVTPVADGSAIYRRVLARDGTPVTDSEPERQERRARQRGRSAIEDAVSVLRFEITGRETMNGRDTIVVRFEPRPDSEPTTREGRIAKVMRGTIWIDEAAREVMRAEATAMDDLSYGFGIIARLNEGTQVTFTRGPVDDGVWLPTSIALKGQGRAILFRKLTIDHTIEWFDYEEIPDPRTQTPNPRSGAAGSDGQL